MDLMDLKKDTTLLSLNVCGSFMLVFEYIQNGDNNHTPASLLTFLIIFLKLRLHFITSAALMLVCSN